MTDTDLAFLAVGVAVVAAVGRLLAYSGKRFVAGGMGNGSNNASGSVATLVSVVFHLVTLGLLALIAVLPIGSTPFQSFMLRIGVLLLVLGVAYAATIAVLARRRDTSVTEAALNQHSRRESVTSGAYEDTPAMSPPYRGIPEAEARWSHRYGVEGNPPQPEPGNTTGQPEPMREY